MFIPYEIHNAKYNMEFDEKLLEKCENEGIDIALRFYGWDKPSVTLGRNQKILGINEQFCAQNNIPIVRRVTGGRALLHDNEITYSIVCNKKILKNGNNVIEDYKEISSTILKSLAHFGINASYGEKTKSNIGAGYCMNLSTICDIMYDGKKFIGSAQYRKNTHILQHGSIPFSFNRELLSEIFMGKVDFSHIIGLNDIKNNFNIYDFMEQLKSDFEAELNQGLKL
ncbi:MAG: lipoate--protein ligase family protein [bacterium]|nr:lipoate--protein ligase family protein [bacterium]